MYEAIRSSARLVLPGGLFCIAIYNKQEYRSLTQLRGSHLWHKVKRLYNHSGSVGRFIMRTTYQSKEIGGMLMSLKNPISTIRSYGSRRGMSWGVDTTDWLGGYPYEFARVDEIFSFCHGQLGMSLENLTSTNSLGCNEFLFRQPRQVSPAISPAPASGE